MSLNKNSSPEQKRDASKAVFEQLSDFFFNQVNFLPYPGRSTSGTVTSTSIYSAAIRVPDTAAGKHLRSDKRSRLRAVFYVEDGGAEEAEAYILSPCAYQATTSLSGGVSSMSAFHAYVGVKISRGVLSLVSKSRGGEERLRSTNIKLSGTTTYSIEIHYNITSAEIFIDGVSLSTIDTDFSDITYSMITTFPLIAPIKSSDGTGVALTLENYQYMQDR